jgi:phospholipase/carboxylesterase
MLRRMKLMHTAHVPAGDGPFSTIIALHGWGANAHDLMGLAPILDAGRSLMLCPQGPVEFQAGPGVVGHGWFPLSSGGPPDPAEFQAGVDAIAEFLDEALPKYPVDHRKTVLLGFSQGGVMAYDLALRNPGRYAGLVALSSWLPSGLAESIPTSPDLENLPTLVIHGTEDPMIPVDMARQSRDGLAKLNVPTTYREFGMGHEISQDALRELLTWLDEKVMHPVLLA